jgi:hypothetical protein
MVKGFAVAREQFDISTRFSGDSTVAIKLDFVNPFGAIEKLRYAAERSGRVPRLFFNDGRALITLGTTYVPVLKIVAWLSAETPSRSRVL